MFDTMTMTKIVGGVCGALLIFLFGNWAATAIYGFGEKSHDEHVELAYSVPGAEEGAAEGTGEEAAEAEPAFAEVYAAADAAAGEKVFGKCKSCHSIEGKDGTGPHLNGVVGRNHGSVAGFGYSAAMAGKSAEPWTEEAIFTFLKNPKEAIPGTKMGFAGIAKPADRANVVAYLATLK
jgi:cytochrome c